MTRFPITPAEFDEAFKRTGLPEDAYSEWKQAIDAEKAMACWLEHDGDELPDWDCGGPLSAEEREYNYERSGPRTI